MGARNMMIIIATFCSFSVFTHISCQGQDQESAFKSHSGISRNVRRSPTDSDAIVFRDPDFENSNAYISSSLSPYQSQTRIANNDRRSRPKSDQANTSDRRHQTNENSRRKSTERTSTSISSIYESRRISPGSSSITFPKDLNPSYSILSSERRPSLKQNSPSQFKQNGGSRRDNSEVRPTVATGSVPYSYLYKWIKQYHKQPRV